MKNNSAKIENRPPGVGAPQIRLLQRLCDTFAVSGDEGSVRKIIKEQISAYADELKVDVMGNLLAVRKGTAPERLRVMIAAHMDEVGMMLTNEDEDGIFRFEAVGGLDARWLAGKPVYVGEDQLPGVIGFKPIHLSTSDETRQAVSISQLRIDMGQENGKRAKVGDRATFSTRFHRSGPSVFAKALDDRLGVATLIELFKHAPANIDLLAAFTVQEEVGLKGARVAAYTFDPHLAIVLDCTPANDLPVWDRGRCVGDDCLENTRYNTRLGAGPAIYIADRVTLSDPRLVRFLAQIAEKRDIPYQFRQPGGGGTDAGAIHKQRAGIPSVSVSVPGRYLHTPVSMIRLDDWKHTLSLIYAALENLTPEILSAER